MNTHIAFYKEIYNTLLVIAKKVESARNKIGDCVHRVARRENGESAVFPEVERRVREDPPTFRRV